MIALSTGVATTLALWHCAMAWLGEYWATPGTQMTGLLHKRGNKLGLSCAKLIAFQTELGNIRRSQINFLHRQILLYPKFGPSGPFEAIKKLFRVRMRLNFSYHHDQ